MNPYLLLFGLLESFLYAGWLPDGLARVETWLGPLLLLVGLLKLGRPARLVALLGLAVLPIAQAFSPPPVPVQVLVFKGERRLELRRDGRVDFSAPVALGGCPAGAKSREGDMRTPVGCYRVTDKDPAAFHRWLGIGYPGPADADRARRQGIISWVEWWGLHLQSATGHRPYARTRLGGSVGLHGGGASRDWTLGCIALENPVADRLYREVPVGAEVIIFP